MIEISAAGWAVATDAVAVGVPVIQADDGPAVAGGLPPAVAGAALPAALDGPWCRRQGFTGRPGQSLVLRDAAGGPIVVLVGAGPPGGDDPDAWRRAGAALVRQAGDGGTAVMVVPDGPGAAERAAAVAEGSGMASYRYSGHRPPTGPVDGVVVAVGSGPAPSDEVAAGVARGAVVAGAVCTARDLINTPPSDLDPATLAERIEAYLAGRPGVSVEVWDERRIAAEGMGGLLGVNRGSQRPPRFVRADYEPSGPEGSPPHLVLVGKGITFDSGGLSLKTAEGMTTMKTDMSGSAAVMAALGACAELGLAVRITALAPVTENMPGGDAVKPGDVLTMRGGTTVEVLNTDAEGRLVLADALVLATELEPAAVVDVATLTGAVTSALGTSIAGLFSNRTELAERVRAAGARAGEKLWPMPLADEYRDHLDTEVADLKNIGRPGQAGAVVAALFLSRFVGDVPWAHLDIAGTGRAAESSGYLSKGGTAFGVRTLVELARSYGAGAGG